MYLIMYIRVNFFLTCITKPVHAWLCIIQVWVIAYLATLLHVAKYLSVHGQPPHMQRNII